MKNRKAAKKLAEALADLLRERIRDGRIDVYQHEGGDNDVDVLILSPSFKRQTASKRQDRYWTAVQQLDRRLRENILTVFALTESEMKDFTFFDAEDALASVDIGAAQTKIGVKASGAAERR